jgi:16S rRNA (cytidine1402-2'-O)-methyltransferase
MNKAKVILIPISIAEDGYDALPAYVSAHINACEVFFVENIRTARRAFKQVDKQFDIDAKEWHEIEKKDDALISVFTKALQEGKTIGIASESGCPGIADPGQVLVSVAQKHNIAVKPLVGPSSILLTLMASGFNGQSFAFHGYLPIQEPERAKQIKLLEAWSIKEHATQLFIETPYRNNQLFQSLMKHLDDSTAICIGYHITSKEEWIKTKTVMDWKKSTLEIPKKPTLFAIGKL